MKTKKADEWIVVSLLLLALFVVFLLFPMVGLLKQSVFNSDGQFSLDNFKRFFKFSLRH